LIDNPTLIEKASNLLLIAGKKDGVNKLILYDPATSNETSLLDEDIEIYHLKPLYDGYVWLDGLDLNGNQHVVGKIQITTNSALRGAVKSVGSFQEMATLSGKPVDLVAVTANPAPPPAVIIGPVIKANGFTNDLTINSAGDLSITVQLDPGEYSGVPVDWWVVVNAGSSWYYLDSATGWTEQSNWLNWRPAYQGALCNLPVTPVLNVTGLRRGSYTFYFAVDYPMNGILNLDQIWVDSVKVNIQ
jgi:hypothetical protein